ncbi:hypothetical protein PUN28_015101 [Cardiocondyla obscurior]|uniref:Uncharacterized protein n=1 Tax=Cardiocondyla obscurior TaxID=286306 RepID=A0AAW2EYV7_9HYME
MFKYKYQRLNKNCLTWNSIFFDIIRRKPASLVKPRYCCRSAILEASRKEKKKGKRDKRHTSSLFFPLKEKSAVTNFGASGFDIALVLTNRES